MLLHQDLNTGVARKGGKSVKLFDRVRPDLVGKRLRKNFDAVRLQYVKARVTDIAAVFDALPHASLTHYIRMLFCYSHRA